jgi:propanol-preferring alcohol dehydrogenase
MKAALLPAPQAPIEIAERPVPAPGPGEVLVRMQACGICHSDLFLAGSPKLPMTPLILGHEGIGIVEELGMGVSGLQRGERVGIAYLHHSCGECDACRRGRENYCLKQAQTGYHVHGALAEYAVAHARFVARVPDTLDSVAAAPLCCAGVTAYKAVRTAALEPGEWVVIFGAGGLGHLAIQMARHFGLRVAAVDVAADKLELAARLGAELVINGAVHEPRKMLAGHGGAAAAITLTASPKAVEQAFPCLKTNGMLVLVGLSPEPYPLPVLKTVLQALRISGVFVGTPRDLQETVDLAATGAIQVHTEACTLEDVPAALERMKRGQILGRMVVKF